MCAGALQLPPLVELRPDRKGVKTASPETITVAPAVELRPDRKGVKTDPLGLN